MALTKATYSMIQGAAYNVLDFGADSTGVASSATAFNNAVANGGTVYVPTGTYRLDSKVTFSVDGTTLLLAAKVTLNLSGVAAVQSPFGNQIHVVANNCAVIGSGPSSLLQISNGSQANAIGLNQKSGFTIKDLTIDGDKANGTAIADDTFMSGISIVVDSGGGATQDARATIDNCVIRNFLQYGINIFGNLSNSIKVVNCNIYSNGKTGDALSVGAGIVSTKSVTDLNIANNVIKDNKFHGVFVSSAGVNGGDHIIIGNNVHQNGGSGIAYVEEAAYGSVNNVGLAKIAVVGNVSWGNTRSGIYFNVDTLGKLQQISITGNTCSDNTYGGIELNSTNTSPNTISNVVISGNQANGNGTVQISTSQFVEFAEGVERPFTPVISGTSTAGVGTYTSRSGTYTITNNIVYFQLECTWSAHTGTGDILVSGFPFAAQNSEPAPIGWVWTNNLTITGQATFGLNINSTSGPLGAVNNGTYSAVALDTAASIKISGFYFAVT
jgi:hypothetical protein